MFLRAYESFDNLRSSPKAGGWLKTVATNLTLNHLTRHRKRWRLFSGMFSDDSREEELEGRLRRRGFRHGASELETDERRARVEQALERLPDHQRVPLVLYHYEEMPYQDIADRLGISLAKVKTDILRGRVAMAGLLSPKAASVRRMTGAASPLPRPVHNHELTRSD